jgi:hypothetical protein
MPYKAEERDGNWVVINTETDEVKATHEPPDAEDKARRQVRLLESIENHEEWDR